MMIVKVPGLNSLGKNKGCRNAGNSIIEELKKIKTNEKGKKIPSQLDLEEIHVDNEDLAEQEKLIYENSLEEFSLQDKILFLGGDHSVTYSIGKAFLEHCNRKNKKCCLIVFDAHADCMKPMKEPTHEEWLRGLVEKGFNPENILLVGVRNMDEKERDFLKKNKIKMVSMNDINNNLEDVADAVTEFANGRELYVSFDIDVIDPVYAPSTGYLEVGGMTARQGIYIMSRLSRVPGLRGLDIVEVDTVKDLKKEKATIKLAAKILAEFI